MKFRILSALAALAVLGLSPQSGFERERGRANDAAKNALEGKAPPPMAGEWFNTNGKSLDWKALKGKVVLLDFWAYW